MRVANFGLIMSTTAQPALDGRKYILKYYDKSTLNDIANYGCVSGAATGFIYTSDIVNFFNAHQDEIENELEIVFGEDYLAQVLKGDDIDFDTLKVRMTWTFVELVAQSEVW